MGATPLFAMWFGGSEEERMVWGQAAVAMPGVRPYELPDIAAWRSAHTLRKLMLHLAWDMRTRFLPMRTLLIGKSCLPSSMRLPNSTPPLSKPAIPASARSLPGFIAKPGVTPSQNASPMTSSNSSPSENISDHFLLRKAVNHILTIIHVYSR